MMTKVEAMGFFDGMFEHPQKRRDRMIREMFARIESQMKNGVSKMSEAKFKVGEKVRVVTKNKRTKEMAIGTEGKIAQIQDDFDPAHHGGQYFIHFSGYGGEWLREEDFEVEGMKKKQELVSIKYKPGTSITDYVKSLIGKEKDKDRLKQLRTFDNCVLPAHVKETIDEAITTVLMAHKFEEWGINDNFEKGLTNSILIYGPPGTGKTMISESIAAVLGKNLMKISSGDIQSNIPGQTERNIRDSFAKAKKHDAVVMFDECDSVLSNRNNVGTILGAEINAMLTEIERFDGVVVLTTNRLHKLDPALQRRIIARIQLAPPEQPERLQIWKNLVPPKMPVHSDVDMNKLSEFRLTGGQIKNCILMAARKAIAQNQDKVEMLHFAKAIRNELGATQDFEDMQPVRIHSEQVEDMDRDRAADRTKGGL